jgi:SAM-dependent methyltransferase
VTGPPREQGLVFGEVAEQYDRARPSYPDALFDAVIAYGELQPGDAAFEIGAGTGKATMGFVGRGLAVRALEPSAEMAKVLRGKGVEVEENSFETWRGTDGAYRLAYAAQAWHWIQSPDRYERVAAALAPGGVIALFWNQGREWTGALGEANNAVYDELAPHLQGGARTVKPLDHTLDELAAVSDFRDVTKRVITWEQAYTSAEWVTLLETHSDHRILPEEQRARVHDAVGRVIDDHGGRVNMTYDVMCYLATRTKDASGRESVGDPQRDRGLNA